MVGLAAPERAPYVIGTLNLHGAAGEPADLARTLLSHGVADLPPNVVSDGGLRLDTVLRSSDTSWVVTLRGAGPHAVELSTAASRPVPAPVARGELIEQARRMLCLDDDLSGFYSVAAADPALSWVCAGAGRMLRSPTVFEDIVKTICTTNCTWAGTVRMVSALVRELGEPAAGLPERRAFPTPEAIASAPGRFFAEVARAGYRGPYLRALASAVAEGRLDLEALRSAELGDDEVRERLLALAGVGPYAVAHVMMLLGRHRALVLDSWTRPTYRRLAGRARIKDAGIERAFRRYREFAGLAFWLTLTEGWVPKEPGS